LQHLGRARIKTDLIVCTESLESRLTTSDALIVKSYTISAFSTRLVVPIGEVLTTTDESKTR
jgi:hypothetical protein